MRRLNYHCMEPYMAEVLKVFFYVLSFANGHSRVSMVQILMLSNEWFVRYIPLDKLSRNSVKNLIHERDGHTNEQKGENYMPGV